MSKIRIYELAKELGVDNKVVINRAIEMGMQGKSSHSNSLDADEADKLRRAIIRQAIGVAPKTEVVTRRVDKTTGTAEAIVESRSGNVIRRRRQVGNESASEPASKVTEISLAGQSSEFGQSIEESEASDQQVLVHQEPEVVVEEQKVVEVELAEPVLTAEIEEMEEPVVPEEVPEAVVVLKEEKVVEQRNGHHHVAPTQAVPAPQVPPTTPEVVTATPVVEEPRKPTIGPKVLGKILLPQKRVVKVEPKKGVSVAPVAPVEELIEEDDEERERKKLAGKKKTRKREFSRTDLLDYEGRDARRLRLRGGGKDEGKEKKQSQTEITKPKQSKRVVKMGELITVGELARQMSLKAGDVIAKLMALGVMATINQAIDQDTAAIVAEEFEFQIESTDFDESVILENEAVDDPSTLKPRPPVVTVMGHVDHGKTSLLDTIRNAAVAEKEHGGITQHIGAYQVKLEDGRAITFIDTPGHAAFTAMRSRGAQVTDIVVLVVAADDGVMPQTIEAINHAKAAKVPIVVAVNKMDKHEANPDRVKKQLVEHGLQPEDWGGDTMYFPVSAIKKMGIKELLEGLLLQAEVKELKANPDRRARGTIIEARQDRGRGVVATVLVQNGTLRVGDIFVSGGESGRIRSMIDEFGTKLEVAGPSVPVEITGLSGVPMAGDDFFVVESDAQAREISSNRANKKTAAELKLATGPISLEEFSRRANNMAAAELNIILKADVHGSVEAVTESLEKLSTPKVKVRVLHAGVGGITESDIQLAIASRAIVVGFGVRAEPRTIQEAENTGVDIRFYRIIYELIDDVKKAMVGLLPPVRQEVPLARAEVRETFTIPKFGTIAGSFVTTGTVKRGAFVRLLRDSRVVHEGKMSSLRRFKDDVKEVQQGYECGIGIDGYNDLKNGDVMEIFEYKEIPASID